MKKAIIITMLLITVFASSIEANINDGQVVNLWNEITSATSLGGIPISIQHDGTPNAWVLNGNQVVVTTALMSLLKTEAEMFGVLAHEAGHIKHGHYQEKVTSAVTINIVGGLLGAAFGGKGYDQLLHTAVDLGTGLGNAGVSRECEVEADDFAVDLAFQLDKNPWGIHSAIHRFIAHGGKIQPSGFNSHPPDDRRLLRISNRIHERDSSTVIPEL